MVPLGFGLGVEEHERLREVVGKRLCTYAEVVAFLVRLEGAVSVRRVLTGHVELEELGLRLPRTALRLR